MQFLFGIHGSSARLPNLTKRPSKPATSTPAWVADVLLNYEHPFFVQKVDG